MEEIKSVITPTPENASLKATKEGKSKEEKVDFFWGSEQFNRLSGSELTSKWLIVKPKIGNLAPVAMSPASQFCVVPFSGGFPTGYGRANTSCTPIPTMFTDNKIIKGFTHFAPSGTGRIGNYYNYFLVKPSAKELKILKEKAGFGTYYVKTVEYECDVTANENSANYHFTIAHHISLIPGHAGLDNDEISPKIRTMSTLSRNSISARFFVDYDTIKLYWNVTVNKGLLAPQGLLFIEPENGEIDLTIQVSKVNEFEPAMSAAAMKEASKEAWEDKLSLIKIKSEDEKKESLFYTALYNCFKKPGKLDGEYYDYATLWDTYKTLLPLRYLITPEESKGILADMEKMYDTKRKRFHVARLFETNQTDSFDGQAAFLADIAFMTAKLYGVNYDFTNAFALATDRLDRLSRRKIPWKHRMTHVLDFIDCLAAYEDMNPKYKHEAARVTRWVYSLQGGRIRRLPFLRYYEGTAITYSYRVGAGTKYRLAYADKSELRGGLDAFFGFTTEPIIPFIKPADTATVMAYANEVNRFEGLNNECDMETMYMYSYLGSHKKVAQIIDGILNYHFHLGADGCCGNDDSGGLSSWIVWNMMGLMPIAGTNQLLIGKPQLRSAELCGFVIDVKGDFEGTYVTEAELNGKKLTTLAITVDDIRQGGTLSITLGKK